MTAHPRFKSACLAVLATVLLAACGAAVSSGGGVAFPQSEVDTVPTEVGVGMAVCAPGFPDCDDMVVMTEQPCSAEGCSTDPEVSYEEVPIEQTSGTPHAVAFENTQVSSDGMQISVQWWSGVSPCTALADVEVVQDASSVTITVHEASVHPDGQDVACIQIAQAKQHTIALDQPLGDREIIDGAR
ncbi:MAG: hypothetical protein ACR2HR_17255 [Euzebya sp.]